MGGAFDTVIYTDRYVAVQLPMFISKSWSQKKWQVYILEKLQTNYIHMIIIWMENSGLSFAKWKKDEQKIIANSRNFVASLSGICHQ